MPISNPLPGVLITVAETEVFSGSSPNPAAWTDLDLSAVVGARRADVLLKFFNNNAGVQIVQFRVNGDSEPASGMYDAPFCGRVPAATHAYFHIRTDGNGICEWYFAAAAQAGTTIDIVGYTV